MLMRFDPFREFDSMAQRLSNRAANAPSTMPMDAYRDGDRLVVQFDMPGVDPSSIDLTAEKNVLTVQASRKWEPAEGQEVIVSERPQGQFTRQLFLGDGLDTDRIDAKYEGGVLKISIPVSEKAKPRKIQVGAGDGDRPVLTDSRDQSNEEQRVGAGSR